MKSIIFSQIILGFFTIQLIGTESATGQSQCLTDAWRQYNAGVRALANNSRHVAVTNFAGAIASCNACSSQFKNTALQMQRNLKSCPPIGTVTAATRTLIFGNWALNDVATTTFIKGKSAEYLLSIDRHRYIARRQDSIAARVLIAQLSYGRCWDPGGFFWSPCKGLLGDGQCCPN